MQGVQHTSEVQHTADAAGPSESPASCAKEPFNGSLRADQVRRLWTTALHHSGRCLDVLERGCGTGPLSRKSSNMTLWRQIAPLENCVLPSNSLQCVGMHSPCFAVMEGSSFARGTSQWSPLHKAHRGKLLLHWYFSAHWILGLVDGGPRDIYQAQVGSDEGLIMSLFFSKSLCETYSFVRRHTQLGAFLSPSLLFYKSVQLPRLCKDTLPALSLKELLP